MEKRREIIVLIEGEREYICLCLLGGVKKSRIDLIWEGE